MPTVERDEASFRHRVLAAFNPHVDHGVRTTPWAGITAQFFLITSAALLYFGVRMVTKEAEAAAYANAHDIVDFERRVGIDIEPWAQDLILDTETIVTFFNWVYIWLHWPVIIGALPSLHVGWNLLAGIVLFQALRLGLLRFLPLVSPILMAMAVVFTANHYVVDALAGVVVALIGLYGAKVMTEWTERRASVEEATPIELSG